MSSGWDLVPDTRDVRPQIHSHCFMYEQTDIPVGVTVRDWRVSTSKHLAARKRERLARILAWRKA